MNKFLDTLAIIMIFVLAGISFQEYMIGYLQ